MSINYFYPGYEVGFFNSKAIKYLKKQRKIIDKIQYSNISYFKDALLLENMLIKIKCKIIWFFSKWHLDVIRGEKTNTIIVFNWKYFLTK